MRNNRCYCDERWMTIADVARVANLHPNTIRKMITNNELNAQRARRCWRIRYEDLLTATRFNGHL